MPRTALAVLFASLVALLLPACNLVDKLTNKLPVGPTPVAPPSGSQPIRYAALGASDAVGYGGTVVCVPLTACPNGTGYVPVLARRLQATRTVTVVNIGLPAAVLSPRIETLGNQYGRGIPGNIIDREVPFVPSDSNLVTVFAGANDTSAIGAAMAGGAGTSDPRAYIQSQAQAFGSDYRTLLAGVRARAPGAYILLMNLPNMSQLPYAQRYTSDERRALQQISVGFSREISGLAGAGVGVVDLMCDAPVYDASRYSGDGFHPNDPGYAHLADLLQNAITAGGASPPPASCPQMTVLPPL